MPLPKLDWKYDGVVLNTKTRIEVPDTEWVVFRVKDNAFLPTLKFYRDQCLRLGCDKSHIDGLDALIDRVEVWRDLFSEKCKNPD